MTSSDILQGADIAIIVLKETNHLCRKPEAAKRLTTGDSKYLGMTSQQVSREISLEQLTIEVKSIYNGIAVTESRCIHGDKVPLMAAKAEQPPDLNPDHWQALIAIHWTLLHEHHDFF